MSRRTSGESMGSKPTGKMSDGPASRNGKFSNDKKAQGFAMTGIPSKNPSEALPDTGSHDTAPERENLVMSEDKK